MNKFSIAALLLASTASTAFAAGLDRSSRSVAFIFEDGNKIELSAGFADPSIDGTDVATAGTGNIADSFGLFGGAIRYELNDQLSFGVLIEEPFGADILYGPATPVLGGTAATVNSSSVTAFGRYKFNERVSVHGGLVYQNLNADVTLSGAAYGPLSDYNAAFSNDSGIGYMLGAAYEIPEIALRVALTYHSEIDHSLDTTETATALPATIASQTEVTTPEQIALAFQTGVAEDTLVFGSVRFSHYSVTTVSPMGLQLATANPEASLTDLENAFDVELGVGRRFSEKWAGSLSAGWSQSGEDVFGSPLGGTNGSVSLAVGASYQASDSLEISGGVRYTQFRDAVPTVGGTPVADFQGNSALSAGLRVQFSY